MSAKPGDIVFFQRFKKSSKRKAPELQVKGHCFGVLLGNVQLFQPDPPVAHLVALLAQIGYVSFDDVGELLGVEACKELITKVEEKYYGKPADPAQPSLPLEPAAPVEPEEPEPSGLVDLRGRPLEILPKEPGHG